jgi:hypothetical protein
MESSFLSIELRFNAYIVLGSSKWCHSLVADIQSDAAVQIERLVLDTSTLEDVGARAMLQARAWTQAANADALMAIVNRAIMSTAQ